MKRSRKKVISIVVACVIVLGAAGAGVYFWKGGFGSAKASTTTSYSVVSLTTGDIEKSITGTGTLAADGTATQNAPIDLTVDEVKATVGQSVKKGDAIATVDTDKLADTIATLRSDLSTLDSSIAQAAAQQDDTVKVTSPVSGRVKQILASDGDDASTLTLSKGGLMVLSTDGLMRFDCTLTKAGAVAAGDDVTVTAGGSNYSGLVTEVSADGKSCVITLSDYGPKVGAKATAKVDGKAIGSGKLSINQPYTVAATTGGVVGTIYVSENQRVYKNSSLVKLIGVPVSQSYQDSLTTRQQKLDTLNAALALQASGTLTADQDGVISTLPVAAGQQVNAGSPVVEYYTGGTAALDVAVDELDIGSVQVGQTATVAVDAVDGKTYDATVNSISQVGTTNNGVTTYTVGLKLADTDGLRIGMNATATIVIEQHKNVLMLPMTALQSSQGEQYVWLYTGSLPEDSSKDPGTRTVVETGLSNDNYVEVTSGLTADDQVVVVRTRSSNSTTTRFGNSGFADFGGGAFSSGGMPVQRQFVVGQGSGGGK